MMFEDGVDEVHHDYGCSVSGFSWAEVHHLCEAINEDKDGVMPIGGVR